MVATLITQTMNNYLPLLGRIHGGSARRHVALMQDLIEAKIKCPPTVADLAGLIRISARTLYESCRRVHGMRPEDILRQMRLHAVHNRLENPQPGETVTIVAHEYAFTNIKYFADAYRKEFNGERPTETFQRGLRRLRIGLGVQMQKPLD
jgi:AraC-like DNA-binding protein